METDVYESKLLARITLRLIPFMLALYVISYLDRINVSFAALAMNRDLGFSDTEFGLGAGIFFIGYCIFGIPSNLVIERLGARRWIAGIMVVWGFLTLLFCLVKTPFQFCALRLLLGIAEAGFFPGMLLYLTYWFPGKYYGSAVARFMTAIPISGIAGSAIAAAALSMSGAAGLAGWKWLFLVTGAPAIVCGFLVLVLLPDRPSTASFLSPEEVEIIEKASNSGSEKEAPPQKAGGETGFLRPLSNPLVWRSAALYFSLTVSMYGFQLWLPQIIKASGSSNQSLDDTTTALLAAIPAIFQALGMLIIARSSDRRGERRLHVVTAAACTFAGLLLSMSSSQNIIQMVGLCLAAFGIWGSVGPFWALTRETLPQKDHATGIAVINSVGNLGGFAGPYLVGLVKAGSQGFAASLVVLAISSIFAMILALMAKPSSGTMNGEAPSSTIDKC
ncbi:MAG: MFS transporter [Cyanobacteria bacterium HKST-UBA02]|nr:MFS transporter [Cyanobacteria bacterium HKST-UBA02]